MVDPCLRPAIPNDAQLLRELHDELDRRGLFAPSRFGRLKLFLWMPTFVVSYFAMMVFSVGPLWLLLAPLAAVSLLNMGFVGHDAGHFALSRRRWVNDLWGQVAMTLLCGMSFGSWRASHNLHHAKCQETEADPDMHFGVLFSVYPNSSNWKTPLGRFFLRIQKWAFWPLASFYWISMGYDGIRDLFRHPKATVADRFLLPMRWLGLLIVPGLVFGWPAVLAFVTVACLSSLMTASVFIPNHIGMRRVEDGHKLSYLEQQVTTSRNIDNPRALDFYYGGLNSQIEHHLFPRAPHHRYRAMRPIVRAFCKKHRLNYQQVGLYRALATVGNHLGSMTAAFRAAKTGTRSGLQSVSPER